MRGGFGKSKLGRIVEDLEIQLRILMDGDDPIGHVFKEEVGRRNRAEQVGRARSEAEKHHLQVPRLGMISSRLDDVIMKKWRERREAVKTTN